MAGRTYGRTVTKTKLSRKGGLPSFVTHGAPRARQNAHGAPEILQDENDYQYEIFSYTNSERAQTGVILEGKT